MFYDTFVLLCEEKGISPSRLLGDLGISKGGLSRWREGTEPTNPIKKKIADYFGITVSELMSGEIRTAPVNKAEADNEMISILQEFKDNPELKTLFSISKNATPEELRQYINVIKALRGGGNE